MNSADCDIVLVRPARAANVAAACRAMKNMGMGVLRLVDPPEGLMSEEARALAYGAWDVLDGAIRAPSLRQAVASCTFVAATSSRAEAEAWTPRRLAQEIPALAAGGRLAIVFGPEASGLTNEEIALCNVCVRIPTAAAHPSLNLAQAVLVVAYELHLAGGDAPPRHPVRANAGEVEVALEALRGSFLEVGFLNPANPDAIFSEIRHILGRAGLTRRDLALLRGLARQVEWAGRIAREARRTR